MANQNISVYNSFTKVAVKNIFNFMEIITIFRNMYVEKKKHRI